VSDSISAKAMLEKFWAIQAKLKAAQIDHSLVVYRHDAVSIAATVPGERWEIDIREDGGLDFEAFKSTPMQGEAELEAAIAEMKRLNEA
jgi:methylglyoxal synthase